MRKLLLGASALALAIGTAGAAMAQSGALAKAVGGYTFEDAVKEAPGTKDFHSKDGKLTFAIITHTAGNGFFDPVYVGAKLAADMVGANLLMLGSEAPVDDIPRELEIINQAVQDPTIDGFIITTPQAGAYNDIVKGLLDKGIPVATTNSFDGTLYDRSQISHTGQDASAAAIGGEALAKCVLASGVDGGSIIFPSTTTLGNVEVNNRITAAFTATVATLAVAGKLGNFKVDAGPENIGIDVDANNGGGLDRQPDREPRRRGRHHGRQRLRHARDRRRRGAAQDRRQGLLLRLRPRAQAAGADQDRRARRRPGPAALPAGLLAGDAALPPDRPRHRRPPTSTRAPSW